MCSCYFYFENLICRKAAVDGYFISPRYTNAMPLKKPATPMPSVIHILMVRDETKTINDRTGIDVRNE